MTDCTSLQGLLTHDQQVLQNMQDDPEGFCQDECSGIDNDDDRILCIKACLRSLPQQEQSLQAAIPRLQDEVNVCTNLLNVWQINANNFTGQLTIAALGGTIADTGFGLSGTVMFTQGSTTIDTITGAWDELAHKLTFHRYGSDGTQQDYTGFLSPTPPPLLEGTFTSSDSPGVIFLWSATS